jgi:hypothetical protein
MKARDDGADKGERGSAVPPIAAKAIWTCIRSAV